MRRNVTSECGNVALQEQIEWKPTTTTFGMSAIVGWDRLHSSIDPELEYRIGLFENTVDHHFPTCSTLNCPFGFG